MDAHHPDRAGGPGDGRAAVLAVRAGRAETDLRRAEARHPALAVAGLRAGRRGVRRGADGGDGHGVPVAVRHGDCRLVVYRRISSDQPGEVVAPFALTYAWILVAPWVFAWYTGIAWVALTQVPRNRMTRWLTLVTVFLALCHSSGGQATPGIR